MNNCLLCKATTKNPKFCSKSCAATYNNCLGEYNRRKPEGTCTGCHESIPSSRTWCKECFSNDRRKQIKIDKWLSGEWSGGTDLGLSQTIRSYLLTESNNSCSKCGFDTPHPNDGRTILEINHINGDGTDHSPFNLEVLCPNCHALTSSYRGRNIGKGRPVYYTRNSK